MTLGRNCPPAQKKALGATEVAGQKGRTVMATLASSSRVVDHQNRESGLLAEIRSFWRLFFARAFNPYRPELHYMRGPGPAWRAKHVAPSPRHST
jgi:hypothetical protein